MPQDAPLYRENGNKDWNTPRPVTPFIYATLGRPVDLDPCSNPTSIVEAKRKIYWDKTRAENEELGIELQSNAEYGDGLEALRSAEAGTTIYANPPFGREEMPEWVDALIAAARRGAEIIALLPSYTSAYWYDAVYQTADAACFWGLPEETVSRLRFVGASAGAGFAAVFVYWGPNEEQFVRTWHKAGQIWHVRRDRILTARICGHTIHPVPDHRPSGELFAYAERRHMADRYAPLVEACTPLWEHTLAELMASDAEHLKEQFLSLTLGEILNGLNIATSAESGERPMVRSKARNRRAPGAPASSHQLPLDRSIRSPDEIARFDEQVLAIIRSAEGISRAALERQTGETKSKLRESLRRLKSSGKIRTKGNKRSTKYHAK